MSLRDLTCAWCYERLGGEGLGKSEPATPYEPYFTESDAKFMKDCGIEAVQGEMASVKPDGGEWYNNVAGEWRQIT
jgi:hypothetical protein